MKTDFNAHALKFAARIDSPWLCRVFFGRSFAGTAALRIAAENKSYRAAEVMLMESAKYIAPNSEVDFQFGKDWDRVQEIAKSDPRLGTLLQRHNDAADRLLETTFTKYKGYGP